MNIKPIKTEADYNNALSEIEGLMMAAPDTPEGDKLDVLVTLVEAYEAKHHPMEMPDPIEAIKFRMEQGDLRPTDMAPIFGRVNRYYEVMTGKRSLTLPMIRALSTTLGIAAEVLIQPTSAPGGKSATKKTVRRYVRARKPKMGRPAGRRQMTGHA